MIIINNQAFAANDTEFAETLFKPVNGKTANGYYKKIMGGIKLYNLQKQLFAFIVNNKFNEQFFVSASQLNNGKIWYSQALSRTAEEYLGIDGLSYYEVSNLAKSLIKEAA